MSEAITLAAVLKGATEVTSLASADRLLAFGQDGSLKKMPTNNFISRRFAPTDIWSLFLLAKENSNVGIFGTLCAYRVNGHVSHRIDFRHGDSTAQWHTHSMIVHPDMRYPNNYEKYAFVKCTYQGEVYYAIQSPQYANDMACYFYGMVMGSAPLFGKMLAESEVSDIVKLTSSASVIILSAGRQTLGGGVIGFASIAYYSAAHAGEGGLHERGYDTHQFGAQGDDDRRDGDERDGFKHRRMPGHWHTSMRWYHIHGNVPGFRSKLELWSNRKHSRSGRTCDTAHYLGPRGLCHSVLPSKLIFPLDKLEKNDFLALRKEVVAA